MVTLLPNIPAGIELQKFKEQRYNEYLKYHAEDKYLRTMAVLPLSDFALVFLACNGEAYDYFIAKGKRLGPLYAAAQHYFHLDTRLPIKLLCADSIPLEQRGLANLQDGDVIHVII